MTPDPDPAPSDLQQQLAALQTTVASLAAPRRSRPSPAWLLVLILAAVLGWTQDVLGLRTAAMGPVEDSGGELQEVPGGEPTTIEPVHDLVSDGAAAADGSAADGSGDDELGSSEPPLRAAPEQDAVALQARLDEVVAVRNELFGENVRLRNQVLELEQRISALIQLREQVGTRPEPVPPRVTSTDTRTPDPWLDALHDALQGSGVAHLRIVEGRLHEGRLHDVLIAELDLMGHTRDIRHVQQLELSSEAGVVFLELTPEVDPLVLQHVGELEGQPAGEVDAEAPAALAVESVRLARWDPSLWLPTGLSLPVVLLPVEDVQHALSGLLAGQGFEIKRLGGFDGGQLLDLQLVEPVGNGTAVTELRAARGVIVADGPALLLYDGEMVQDGEARAFYKGRHKLPLPGADHEAWRAAIGG